jgi:hypothetical protein
VDTFIEAMRAVGWSGGDLYIAHNADC